MAKERRNNSSVSALTSLLSAINKVAEAELGNVTPEQQAEANKAELEAVKVATAVIGDSNVMTTMELQDDAIEQYHEQEAEAEAEAEAEEEAEIRAENDETIEDLITEEEEEGF